MQMSPMTGSACLTVLIILILKNSIEHMNSFMVLVTSKYSLIKPSIPLLATFHKNTCGAIYNIPILVVF